jgi:hypothetical protein
MNDPTARAVDTLAEAMGVAITIRDRMPGDTSSGMPPVRHATALVDALNDVLRQLLAEDLERLGLRYGEMPCRDLVARIRQGS